MSICGPLRLFSPYAPISHCELSVALCVTDVRFGWLCIFVSLAGGHRAWTERTIQLRSHRRSPTYSMFRALAKFHGDTGKEFLAGTVNTVMDAIVMSMVRDGPLVSSIIWVRWAADGRCTGVSSIAEVGYSTSWTVVRGCPSMSSQTAHPPTRSFTRICPPRWMGVMW